MLITSLKPGCGLVAQLIQTVFALSEQPSISFHVISQTLELRRALHTRRGSKWLWRTLAKCVGRSQRDWWGVSCLRPSCSAPTVLGVEGGHLVGGCTSQQKQLLSWCVGKPALSEGQDKMKVPQGLTMERHRAESPACNVDHHMSGHMNNNVQMPCMCFLKSCQEFTWWVCEVSALQEWRSLISFPLVLPPNHLLTQTC